MRNDITTLFAELLTMVPTTWSEPKINVPEQNAITANFDQEQLMLTILQDNDNEHTIVSYRLTGDASKEIKDSIIKPLVDSMNAQLKNQGIS